MLSLVISLIDYSELKSLPGYCPNTVISTNLQGKVGFSVGLILLAQKPQDLTLDHHSFGLERMGKTSQSLYEKCSLLTRIMFSLTLITARVMIALWHMNARTLQR